MAESDRDRFYTEQEIRRLNRPDSLQLTLNKKVLARPLFDKWGRLVKWYPIK